MGMEVLESVSHDLEHLGLLPNGSGNRLHIPQGRTKEGSLLWAGYCQLWGCSQQGFQKGRVTPDDLRLSLVQWESQILCSTFHSILKDLSNTATECAIIRIEKDKLRSEFSC